MKFFGKQIRSLVKLYTPRANRRPHDPEHELYFHNFKSERAADDFMRAHGCKLRGGTWSSPLDSDSFFADFLDLPAIEHVRAATKMR